MCVSLATWNAEIINIFHHLNSFDFFSSLWAHDKHFLSSFSQKKFFFWKKGRKHPVVASILLSIKLPVIFWDSPHHTTEFMFFLFLTMSISLLFRVKYVTMFNDTFPTCTQLLMLINWCSSVTRERARQRKKKKRNVYTKIRNYILKCLFLLPSSGELLHAVTLMLCSLYDDDDDQLVCLTFKWRHEFLPFFSGFLYASSVSLIIYDYFLWFSVNSHFHIIIVRN